jgi:hypothetical protein
MCAPKWLIHSLALGVMLLGPLHTVVQGALATSVVHDAGVWIPFRANKTSSPRAICPTRIYLGGRGASYATGIVRTASFAPFAKTGAKVTVAHLSSGISYVAPVAPAFASCSGTATFEPGIFVGESYRYEISEGSIRLFVVPGPSLSLSPLGVYQGQPLFSIAENL